MKKLKQLLPGIILAVVIAVTGRYISNWIPNLGGVTLTIIIGFIVGNLFDFGQQYTEGIRFAEKKILALAIMLMGFKLKLNVLTELGFSSMLIIIVMVLTTIMTGILIGKLFGLSNSFSLLLGVGNGVCGSSAIAATAPIVSDSEEEIGISISVVNLLGTIGIFLLPIMTHFLELSDAKSGLMIGSTLQATGQVVAAGFSISDIVGKVATVVKMGRILMLGPVVLLLSLFSSNKNEYAPSNINIPPFIIGFFLFSILATIQIFPSEIINILKNISKILLTIAMAGIGLKINISSLLNQGGRALLVGFLIFGVQLTVITGLMHLFF
jgi:uncharacterized integral membrane protein (TIGR00698 family)